MQNGTLSRRERKRLSQRDEYLLAADRLFREKGFEKTSIEDISEAVDMGVGSFYYYFSSKEDLVANILLQATREVQKQFHKARDEGKSLRESAEGCARCYLDFHEKYGTYLDIVNAVRQGQKKASIAGETIEAIFGEMWECVVTLKMIYEKYSSEGRWEGMGPEEVAVVSWAFTIGIGQFKQQMLSYFPHLNIDRIIENALDIVLKKG